MPEKIKNFVDMIRGQMSPVVEHDWTIEEVDVQFRPKESEWVVKMKTSEVGFVFTEIGQFKYCYNWKE